jgi:DNA repair protein RadC
MIEMIRDLPFGDRPRERMLAHGPAVLSDSELLAVLLGTGAEGKSAIYLARELLHGGGLRKLSKREQSTLIATRGVGPAKAARITAMFELARRLATEPFEENKRLPVDLLGAKLVSGYGHRNQEHFGAAFLDGKHRVTTQRDFFYGTADKTPVCAREVVRFALLEHAAAVVVYHNHPSGDPTPSADDIAFTQKLKQSLAIVDLELLDHLVIGSQGYMSMRARGQC